MKKAVSILSIVLVSIFGLVASVAAVTNHSGHITVDETWTLAGSPHIVESLVVVEDNATLTIEPGVEVRFNKDATNPRLIIGGANGPGKLIAQGTDTQKIIFTSNEASPQPGDWKGLLLWTGSDDSIMENAIVEYGGMAGSGNIRISNANCTVRNCIIRKSLGYGIDIGGSPASEISGCRIESNAEYGIKITSSSPDLDANEFINNGSYPVYIVNGITSGGYPEPVISSTNTFSGNNPDQIYFAVCSISQNHTLRYIGIPYYFPALATVQDGATLSIEPGVEVRFNKDATNPRLIIGGVTAGRLIAQGTDTQKIIFTSNEATPQPGDWKGILLWTGSDDSIMENAIVEYGGMAGSGNIRISNANCTVRNCIIRKSLGYGIDIGGSPASEILCCDITENEIGVRTTSSTAAINYNNIFGNLSYGVYTGTSSYDTNAENNWWGDASGPGGEGPGTGDAVSAYVSYDPWLSEVSPCTFPIDADFTADVTSGVEDLTVHFTDRTTSPEGMAAWEWDLDGDGTIDSTEQNPIFLYTEPGVYTVTLIAYETDGDSDTESKVNYITVSEALPIEGDLDGNGDVDRDDLNIILSHRNQPASVCPECDLDGDGMITALDARKLVLLCTCPRCVCE